MLFVTAKVFAQHWDKSSTQTCLQTLATINKINKVAKCLQITCLHVNENDRSIHIYKRIKHESSNTYYTHAYHALQHVKNVFILLLYM